MFERFAKEAKAVVVGAQQVARDTGTGRIDTRHLLVSIAESDGPASRALDAVDLDPATLAGRVREELRSGGLDGEALAVLGIDLDAVRASADAVFGDGSLDLAGRRRPGHIPFAADAKKSLQLALREAIRLDDRRIDSGHLLLGMLRADCSGREALRAVGVDLDALRRAIEVPVTRSA